MEYLRRNGAIVEDGEKSLSTPLRHPGKMFNPPKPLVAVE
jgi:hypothetical protein